MKRNIKIAGIGGGTGLSTLLQGIKFWTHNITAIVTVTDDGGSSGRLRKEFNMPPPGDIRNCIASLAEADSLLSELFQYRFAGKSNLSGHSFGNLFIAAMTSITGNFAKGILETGNILAIKGRVLPTTLENVVLGAKFMDGSVVQGQTKIIAYPGHIEKVFLVPDSPQAYPDVLQSCLEADMIILGPGSLFTSIVPNLLVKGVSGTIKKSKAIKVYVCNIMTQPGETDNFTVADHLLTVEKYLGCSIDYLIINNGKISESLIKKYHRKNSFVIEDDSNKLNERVKIVKDDIVNKKDYARHDPEKLSKMIFKNIF